MFLIQTRLPHPLVRNAQFNSDVHALACRMHEHLSYQAEAYALEALRAASFTVGGTRAVKERHPQGLGSVYSFFPSTVITVARSWDQLPGVTVYDGLEGCAVSLCGRCEDEADFSHVVVP